MTDLTRERIANIDREGMWELAKAFPQHWNDAMELSDELDMELHPDRYQNVCLAGMGGSAIGADLLRAYSYHSCPVPVEVVRHYKLPGWVGENTLFVACSYSGNTEETLSALKAARERGADCVAITSGNRLMIQAADAGFDYVKIPGGMPPRAALAYMFVPLYRIFGELGWLDEDEIVLRETSNFLEEQIVLLTDLVDNEALSLAKDLQYSLPIVYSDSILLGPVNLRLRGQLEENAKTLAYGNVLPEMNHNEIVGWEQIAHLTGRLSVVMLKDRDDSPNVQARMEITKELIEDQVISFNTLQTKGKSRLTRMFSLVQIADWTSIYLALLNEVDPTPVARIDLLKSKLAEL